MCCGWGRADKLCRAPVANGGKVGGIVDHTEGGRDTQEGYQIAAGVEQKTRGNCRTLSFIIVSHSFVQAGADS